MGQEVTTIPLEVRKERVIQALHILLGHGLPRVDEEENAILGQFRELRQFGYGRMEVIVVSHRMDGVNWTKHMKRKDFALTT